MYRARQPASSVRYPRAIMPALMKSTRACVDVVDDRSLSAFCSRILPFREILGSELWKTRNGSVVLFAAALRARTGRPAPIECPKNDPKKPPTAEAPKAQKSRTPAERAAWHVATPFGVFLGFLNNVSPTIPRGAHGARWFFG